METVTLSVRLPKELHEALRTQAFQERTTINNLICSALYPYKKPEKERTNGKRK